MKNTPNGAEAVEQVVQSIASRPVVNGITQWDKVTLQQHLEFELKVIQQLWNAGHCGRELALVRTKLEEAAMWLERVPNVPMPAPPPEPSSQIV